MTTSVDTLHWVPQKQAELTDMEWDWRQQDERESLSVNGGALASLAKREKEAEASRLQAELAVASFVEQFYLAKQVAIGEELVEAVDVNAWEDPAITRDSLARFVQAEASRIAAPRLASYWGWPTSRGGKTGADWLVELPAVFVQDERAQSWEQYRFHVAGKHINGWTASPTHTPEVIA